MDDFLSAIKREVNQGEFKILGVTAGKLSNLYEDLDDTTKVSLYVSQVMSKVTKVAYVIEGLVAKLIDQSTLKHTDLIPYSRSKLKNEIATLLKTSP